MRKKLSVIMTVVVVIIGSITPASSVHATSSYDNYYLKTNSLELKNASCSKDVTLDYENYLGSYSQSYQNAVESGSVGVSELPKYTVDINGNVIDKAVVIFWNENDQMSLDWTSWGGIVASPVTYSLILQLSSCNNGGQVNASNFGAGYLSISDGSVKNYLYRGSVNYSSPSYEGLSINIPIQGSAQCWDTVSQVYVATDSGMNGNARLTDSFGGKAYNYELTDSGPYRLYVTCGGKIGVTPVIYDTSRSYDFVCNEEEYLGLVCYES